jgi:hypothetical protein
MNMLFYENGATERNVECHKRFFVEYWAVRIGDEEGGNKFTGNITYQTMGCHSLHDHNIINLW